MVVMVEKLVAMDGGQTGCYYADDGCYGPICSGGDNGCSKGIMVAMVEDACCYVGIMVAMME